MLGANFISLLLGLLVAFAQGKDPVNDVYDAAVLAAEVTGLDKRVTGYGLGKKNGYNDRHGATWLIATSMAGNRMKDLREREGPYAGTAISQVDAHWGRQRYARALEKGYLTPERCKYHRDDGTPIAPGAKPYAAWSTRGAYDSSVHNQFKIMERWVGTDCFPVEWFDTPLFAALSAADYAIITCDRYHMNGRHGRKCDRKFLRCIWAGIGKCEDEDFKKDLHERFRKWMIHAREMLRYRGDLPPLPPGVRARYERVSLEHSLKPFSFQEDFEEIPPPRPLDR